jgi:hypothetical protein
MPKHELVIIAQSENIAAFSDQIRVTVYVNDKNDNSPVIKFPNDTFNVVHVSNLAPVGYPFTRIDAEDPDYDKHADLTYATAGGGDPNDNFLIDSKTGVVSVNCDLRPLDQKEFILHVVVRDDGNPSRATSAVLRVVANSSAPLLPRDSSGILHQSHRVVGKDAVYASGAVLATYLTAMIGAAVATCLLLIVAVAAIIALGSKRRRRRQVSRKVEPPSAAAASGPDAMMMQIPGGGDASHHPHSQHQRGSVAMDGCSSETTDPPSEGEEYIKPRVLIPSIPSDIPDITLSLHTDFRDGKVLIIMID